MDTATLRSRLAEFPDIATSALALIDDGTDQAQIDQLWRTVRLLEQGLTLSNAEKAALAAQLAACRDNQPDPDPDPDPPPPDPLVAVQFGACPRNGSNLASVRTLFGSKSDARWFDAGMGVDRIPDPPDGMGGHASWKTLQDGAIFVEGVRAAVSQLDPELWLIETEHEHDVKHQKAGGTATANAQLAQRLELKADFHDAATIVDHRWAERTVSTVAWWRFSSDQEYDEYVRLYVGKAAILGVDFDGIDSVAGKPYADYGGDLDAMERIRDAADRFYDGRVTGGEFGWPQRPDDQTGALRAQAIRRQVPLIVAALPDIVQLHLFDSASFPGYPLVDDVEVEAWRSFVATNT
jgi:hypothetical protein